MATSQYSDLYKNNSKELLEQKQNDRRQLLLTKQKEQRNKDQDDSRNIQSFLRSLRRRTNQSMGNGLFKNYVQLSEWLHEKPDDFEQWFMVPCPKGKRCIAVATGGATKIYNKFGVFVTEFRSGLPGDICVKHKLTILDCFAITAKGVTKYMVLDMMYYSSTDIINCETSFRFFWVASKLSELQLDEVNLHNEFAFMPLKYVDCGDEIAVDTCLACYPMWDEENIDLDGLLFYHKDSSYVHGTTPLVGWLYSFMLREILEFCVLNPKYAEQRPADYVNASAYIADFNEKRKRRPRCNNRGVKKMEVNVEDENESLNMILNNQRTLELEGRTVDDFNEVTMDGD